MNQPISGVCRFCHCTEATPCSTPPCGEPCAWANRSRTVCTAPNCMRAWGELKQRAELQRRLANRKRTPAQIHDLIMRKKRGNRGQRKLKGIKPGDGRDAA